MDVSLTRLAFAAAAGLAFCSVQASAQETPDRGDSAGAMNPVHCVSGVAGARHYCGNARVKYVIESPSPGSCVKGKTWDSDENGVWVSGSCNANFDGEKYVDPDTGDHEHH